MTNQDERVYQAFLLRIWCDSKGEWRIVLQSAETLEKITLTNLNDLLPHLYGKPTDDQPARNKT